MCVGMVFEFDYREIAHAIRIKTREKKMIIEMTTKREVFRLPNLIWSLHFDATD